MQDGLDAKVLAEELLALESQFRTSTMNPMGGTKMVGDWTVTIDGGSGRSVDSVCLSGRLPICLSACLSFCLSFSLCIKHETIVCVSRISCCSGMLSHDQLTIHACQS